MFFGDRTPPHLDPALVSDLAQAPWHKNSLIDDAPDQRKMKISQSRGCDGCARSPPQVPEVHSFVDQRLNQSEFIVLFRSRLVIVSNRLLYCSILIHWLCSKIENTGKELISLTHPFHKTCFSLRKLWKSGFGIQYKAFTHVTHCSFILSLTGKVVVWI